MGNPTAAMLVIGDEILSGRTRDSNMHFLAGELTKHGIDLREVRMISDDEVAIIAGVTALSETHDHVFTSGGIGPTHDDITADCIAKAFGAHLDVRDDARAILQAHYDKSGTELNEARLRMARIPDGAALIDNPVSAAPGFTCCRTSQRGSPDACITWTRATIWSASLRPAKSTVRIYPKLPPILRRERQP